MTHPARFDDLNKASVFVTGGASGIGAALVDGLLAQGARVALIDRADAAGLGAEMTAKHGRAPLALRDDVTDTAALQAAIATAAETHGPVTVLINNAADDRRHTLAETTPELWDALMAVNLKAYVFACQAVAPGMRDAGGGAIVNFSSTSYMMGMAGMPAYTSANAAITGLTRSLARELGPDNIRVNAIAPGWVLTPKQLDLWATPESLAAHLDRQCLKRHLEPADMVAPVLFLASDASGMMTGQCMPVDGGYVVTG